MSGVKLVTKSLLFYWRTNLGVLLAALVSSAVLIGALVVGDSVRHSLKKTVNTRLGKTSLSLVTQDRFFRDKLAQELSLQLDTVVAPVLQLRGVISNSDGSKRANRVEILGVDEKFYQVGTGVNPFGDDFGEGIVLNEPLAEKLGVKVGDEIVLRIAKPGLMPRDIPLTPDSDLSIAFRLEIKAVAGESAFGRFSLQANHVSSLNVFVPIEWLQEKLGRSGQANMLLAADNGKADLTVESANEAVRKCWQLLDAGLELRRLDSQAVLELRSSRIFIDESLSVAAMKAQDEAVGVLTYFVNELRLGDKTTPYSLVTAISKSNGPGSIVPKDMLDEEVIINQWLADDLNAKESDVIELTYFVVGPMRKLVEQKQKFRVRAVVPMEGSVNDPDLMPDFPGLSDVENCRDWKPGIPINLDKIRKRDEEYWDKFKGTPKAFITLSAGQEMWENRYGNLTAVRYRLGDADKVNLAEQLLKQVEPATVGLFFLPVREQGIKAQSKGTDFGQLFLGFSFFLIIASVLLMGLLFVFGVESRTEQLGMLKALGLPPGQVKWLLLAEGAALAVIGAIGGVAAGLLYTKLMIFGLATIWRVAISGTAISFYAKASTVFVGALAAVGVSLFAIWLTVHNLLGKSARELLAGQLKWQFFGIGKHSKKRAGLWLAALSMISAVILLALMAVGDSAAKAGAFFAAGTLLLIAGIALIHSLLAAMKEGLKKPAKSLAGLGIRNSTRRIGRSLTVVGLLASGVFLVIAVGANRQNPMAHADRRDSGTGGFALFAETSIGVLHNLNSKQGRESLGLDETKLGDVDIVQLRVRDGDDASCFNLNRAQKPRLLGVVPAQLQSRKAFAFTKVIKGAAIEDGWELLKGDYGENVVPAIGDSATITWALGKSIGDEIEYSDSRGQKFKVLLAGMLKNSILQGALVISEDAFVKRFTDEQGYRMFLVDSAKENSDNVSQGLSTGLRDYGFEVMQATERLAAFSEVENTYISIFQMLGGLGLILGSIGLGLIVLRNVLDRRGELAMLRAVGFGKDALKRMVFYEHVGLMLCGLTVGVLAAIVAVGPVLGSPRAQIPYLSLSLTITAIGISGAVWIWMAATFALSGKMLEALREE